MIIVAIDSFKGSLSSVEACEIVKNAIIDSTDKVLTIPIADGGEGTAEAFYMALGGSWVFQEVTGPDWVKRKAGFLILPDGTGVIEMAQASGITLVKELDPLNTTTYGTGELILGALDAGCSRLIVGIGGSATNDGGVGMAAALGGRFYNSSMEEINPTGGSLSELDSMDLSLMDSRLKETEIIVACDVTNEFYGPNGASFIYGPQKGADRETVEVLDDNLKKLAELIMVETGINLQNIPGSGAAGGLGGGLVAFTGGKLRSGIDILLDTVGFGELIKGANLVITGEGSFDEQSLTGKVVSGISRFAREVNVPVIVFAGSVQVDRDVYMKAGITAAFSTNRKPCSLEEAKRDVRDNLFELASSFSALWHSM
ncbi:MAG: glycerate kinase [Fusobacteria bacterium]|nr:MAG: glycerate kinase [Fusobacteriota bacterium]KAF0228619.1 MAG: glycerate [Fusobacteriota bacterium]